MAKVLFGAGTVDMRNKLEGWVYSKNRYGSYARRKTTPVNPQTAHQQSQRAMFGNLSSSWRGLTKSQRQSWIDAAENFKVTDIFGYAQKLSGNALFIALNKNLINIGKSVIQEAPSPQSIPSFLATDITLATGPDKITIDVSESSIPSDYSLAVYATPNVGPGVNYLKNKFRFIGTASVTSGSADITTEWADRFGALVDDQKIAVRVRLISEISGQGGVASEVSDVV